MLTPARVSRCLLLVLLAAGCRSAPEAPPQLTEDPRLDAFARRVAADLEGHAWQELIAAADKSHYRTQVVEHGMAEPQYVAELFGLHRVDNDIGADEGVAWSDLERIENVELASVSASGAGATLMGSVTLRDGSTLDLRARAALKEGRWVLTGGVG